MAIFDFLRRKKGEPIPPGIRETLFGDMPLDQWPKPDSPAAREEPWATFVRAREAIDSGQQEEAIATWRAIVERDGLEGRHYAQAWHFLRRHRVTPAPSELSKRLLGVVLEVPVSGGLDLLAAYADRSASYYNFSGAGVVWERPDGSLDASIDALLAASQPVLNAIGPWDQPRPPAPPPGQARINFLSPAGLHFGQAPMQALAGDALAAPVLKAGIALMQALIAMSRQG